MYTFIDASVQGYSLKPPLAQGTSRHIIDLLSTGNPTDPADVESITEYPRTQSCRCLIALTLRLVPRIGVWLHEFRQQWNRLLTVFLNAVS